MTIFQFYFYAPIKIRDVSGLDVIGTVNRYGEQI